MLAWLMHIGEELPVDTGARDYRYGMLARALNDRGCDVVRWAPTFRHTTKKQRFSQDHRVCVRPGYDLQFVYAPGYPRNVSLRRVRMYGRLRREFKRLAANEPRPDVIVAAIPSLEWAEAAIEYGRVCGAPVVIDVRDLWPDVFLNAAPSALRPLARRALGGAYRKARQICRDADALSGVSETYLHWALGNAGRRRRDGDRYFPIGFETPRRADNGAGTVGYARLRAMGVDPNRPICAFAGLFERSCDLQTVIAAAERMRDAVRSDLQFVLCGDGRDLPAARRRAAGLDNVFLPGWVDAETLSELFEAASIGLCAYAASAKQSLPNKPFEYLANGLAVVSCLRGELADLIERERCGANYTAGDPASLQVALESLLADPATLRATRARAAELADTRFNCKKIYREFAEHLGSLTTRNRLAA